MKSLLTQIKHAKITTREVLIHLKKNGELKRKAYSKYLKAQYLLAGETYATLQCKDSNLDPDPENPYNIPTEKKLTMPVHFVKSEMSIMSKSFEDTSFLTEAWLFFQKEMMAKAYSNTDLNPRPEIIKTPDFATMNSRGLFGGHDDRKIPQHPTHTNSLLTQPQLQLTVTPASGFDKLNHHYRDPQKNTSLCVQVLKWAQEGKLNLN